MLQQEFIAKTQSGITFSVIAENAVKGLQTTYPIKLRTTLNGNKYCAILDRMQAQEILGIDLPKRFEECGVPLVEQDGWLEFEQKCSLERYNIREAWLEEKFPGIHTIVEARNASSYPLAAAYLKAKEFAQSENIGKYSAGQKAVKLLEIGFDYELVIEDMEAEWSAYCQAHIND